MGLGGTAKPLLADRNDNMRLRALDVIVLIIYFVTMVGIGVFIKRRASKNLDAYFLSEKKMPWWLLGISNASAMWDVTGTMWLVTVLFTYGMKGIFLPWLWPVFNQVFDAVYLSKWIRRSNVRTGAEWITTRFGTRRGGELSRSIIVLFAVISVVSFIGYEFEGIGKFSKDFLDPVFHGIGLDLSPKTYALLLMVITAVYVVMGGMMSVVLTDFAQFLLMAVSAVVIGGIAIIKVAPERIDQLTPPGWRELTFGWNINLDWGPILPAMNEHIAKDGWAQAFGLFFMVMVFKGIMVSMAGAAPNYDMQRILASRNPKEASMMSAIVSVCLFPRWIMIGGITLLGLGFAIPDLRAMGANVDLEQLLPIVINRFLPAGLVGVLLAGLLSSFMANFSATVNAGAAYLVNDLYKRFVNPEAGNRTLIRASYVASMLIVVVGMFIGYFLTSINQITQWIVSGLFGGYSVANVLKWYWWRLNGSGYFGGMLVGIASSLVGPLIAPNLHPLYIFLLVIFPLSAITCVAVSLLTEPVEDETLMNFYANVRPWGFWKPVRKMLAQEGREVQPNTSVRRDFLNIAVGIAWQLTLVTMPLYALFRDMRGLLILVLVFVTTSIFLKRFWYNPLMLEEGEWEATSGALLPSPQIGD